MSNLIKNPSLQICSTSFNKNEILNCEQHFQNITKKLQAFYVDQEFFDIVLIDGIDKVSLPAHRVILSASSDYFLAMFRNNLGELRSTEVELEDIDSGTLKQIVDYMYTASIELSCETAETVLRAADFFQMDALIAICCDFMGRQLDVSNCLGIALFAEQHSYEELYKKCSKFAYEHFEKVCGEKEFYQLNDGQLAKFLKNDHRYKRSEENLFLALLGWVEHDEVNRKKLLSNILSHVRFQLLKPKFIVENRPSVGKSIESDDMIFSWLQWHLSPETRTVSSTEQKKSKKLVFVTSNGDNLFGVSIYNSELNFWSYDNWPHPPIIRTEYSTVVINSKLIIAGGLNILGDPTDSVECLDLETMEWKSLAPMLSKRSKVAIVELNDLVYVVGGFDGEEWTQEVHMYDFDKNLWEEVEPLPEEFSEVQAAVLFGVIYAASDSNPDVVYYDPEINEWTNIAPRSIPESEQYMSGIVAVGEYLYVVQGDCYEDENNVQRYDPSKDSWTSVSSLDLGRHKIKCVALDNRLVACAGTHNNVQQQLVDEYDPETDKWTSLTPLLEHGYLSSNLFTV